MEGNSNTFNTQNDPYIGKEIDKYVLMESLGKGGMGLVYKAQHKNIKRQAALKLLPQTQTQDEVSIKRLEREATAMGSLQHPNIATMYDFGITREAQPYIVLELIRGKSLNEIFKEEGSIDVLRCLRIFIQIASGMDYAHEKGVIHRDLKPANIMITDETYEDQVKILDFGIARSTEESMMLTKTGQIMGSAAYMSPEQCTGKKPVDFKTDIYALGVMMYQLLTGKLPYKGDTFLQTIFLKTTEHPSPFPDHLKQFPGLEALVLKSLMADPSDRPESMASIKAELEKILEEQTATGIPAYNTSGVAIDKSREVIDTFSTENISNPTGVLNDTTSPLGTAGNTTIDEETKALTQRTISNIKEQSDKNYKLLVPIGLAILFAIGLVLALVNNGNEKGAKTDTKNSVVKKQTKTDDSDSYKSLPVSGASATDFLMNQSEKAEEKAEAKPKHTKRRRASVKPVSVGRSYTPPKPRAKQTHSPTQANTRETMPPVAPPVVQQQPQPTYQPPRHYTPHQSSSTSSAPKKIPSYKSIKKSYEHHRRKVKKIIKKFF